MNVTAIWQFDKRTSALALLCLGLCAHALFYVRSIIFAPELYLGPSGADRVFYYAYARSLVIDHDLDFQNDLAVKPPSSGMVLIGGKPHNKYPIGMPLLSLPFYAGAHLLLNGDGYSKAYVVAFALGQMTRCILGFVLLYLTLLRYFDPQLSSLATVSAMFGTPLLRFTGADLMMSHAAAFFSLTWCFFEASRLQTNETVAVVSLKRS